MEWYDFIKLQQKQLKRNWKEKKKNKNSIQGKNWFIKKKKNMNENVLVGIIMWKI